MAKGAAEGVRTVDATRFPTRIDGRYPLAVAVLGAALHAKAALGGSAAAGNAVLHGLVAGLAWFAARRLSRYYGTALAAAVLFAVHPLHVGAVASGAAGRGEILAAGVVLAGWIAHRRSAEAGGRWAERGWALAAGALLLAATSGNPYAVAAPLVYLAHDLLRGRETGAPVSESLQGSRWIAEGVALASALALRFVAVDGSAAESPVPGGSAALTGVWERAAAASWLQVRHAWSCVWPFGDGLEARLDAVPPVVAPTDPRFAVGVVFLGVLAWLVVRGYRSRRTLVGVAAVLWAAFLLPPLVATATSKAPAGESLRYLPSLAACLVAGHALAAAAARGEGTPNRRGRVATVIAAALVIALALAVETLRRDADRASVGTGAGTLAPRAPGPEEDP